MINGKSVLVTICCRGGSKGIPNKGLKVLGGKPLIQWTTALIPALKYVDGIIVSSDSDAILECAKQNIHITMPTIFKLRDPKLATDTISRVEAIKDATKWAEYYIGECSIRKPFDIIVDLGVATPFKTAGDVNQCIEMLQSHIGHITTVTEAHRNPYFSILEVQDGTPYPCKTIDSAVTSRQTAPKCFDMNDAVNVWWRAALFNQPGMCAGDRIYEMPPERSIHLDTPLDWALAEAVIEKQLIGGDTNGD